MSTEGERLALLEYKESLSSKQLTDMNTKLDELLQLRTKGMGAFWLASSILGTGIIGVIVAMISWMRG